MVSRAPLVMSTIAPSRRRGVRARRVRHVKLPRVVGVLTTLELLAGLVVPAPAEAAFNIPVSKSPTPTYGTEHLPDPSPFSARVWNSSTHGNSLYLGGEFTALAPTTSLAGAIDDLRRRIRAREFADDFRLAVEDSGPGIPTANVERVFEPFFTTKAEGSGVGLATALRIVKECDGVLRCRPAFDGKSGGEFVIVGGGEAVESPGFQSSSRL